jgi:hypothetical protein
VRVSSFYFLFLYNIIIYHWDQIQIMKMIMKSQHQKYLKSDGSTPPNVTENLGVAENGVNAGDSVSGHTPEVVGETVSHVNQGNVPTSTFGAGTSRSLDFTQKHNTGSSNAPNLENNTVSKFNIDDSRLSYEGADQHRSAFAGGDASDHISELSFSSRDMR